MTLLKNKMIYISLYDLHNDPKNFPNPDQFNPDRFSSKNNFDPIAYLPFAAGPRMCIGMYITFKTLT